MQSKRTLKRMAWVALLALVLAMASSTMAAPPAQEPESIACGDSISCSTAGNAVYVQNSGTGPTIYGRNTSTGDGLKGRGNPGVYGGSYHAAGVRGKSNQGVGVKGESVDSDGVHGFSVNNDGVYGESTNDTGVQGNGPTGVYGQSAAYSGQGVHGHGANVLTEGVLGTAAYGIGVYGISDWNTGDAIGVLGQTGATWGLYSNNDLYVAGSCTGCTMAFVGQNAENIVLNKGDVVSISGVAPPLKGQQAPVLKVQRAKGTSGGALGIVESRAEVSKAELRAGSAGSEQRNAIEVTNRVQGPVSPGEYLFIVVQGLVQVRADASVGIEAGDRLMAGSDGQAVLAEQDGQLLGQALDAVDPASGLVWVLVDLQ